MKGFVKLLTLCVLVAFVAACGAQTTQAPAATEAPKPADTAAAVAKLSASEQWAKTNGFGPYQPAEEDWAAIETAAKAEGKVVVYCNSSKFAKLLDAWAALYPDVALEGGDTDDIAVKMAAEQEAGNIVGDVWYNSDGHLLYGEFIAQPVAVVVRTARIGGRGRHARPAIRRGAPRCGCDRVQ